MGVAQLYQPNHGYPKVCVVPASLVLDPQCVALNGYICLWGAKMVQSTRIALGTFVTDIWLTNSHVSPGKRLGLQARTLNSPPPAGVIGWPCDFGQLINSKS